MKTRRQPPPLPVAVLTYAQLAARVVQLEAQLAKGFSTADKFFSVKEMDMLREQLTERAARAEAAKDTLEWRLRRELQRVRQAEDRVVAAATDLRGSTNGLEGALDGTAEESKAKPRHLAAVG